MFICSDSHGRDLSHKVQQRTTGFNVTASVLPSARLCDVAQVFRGKIKSLTKRDTAVLIAGCNDLEKTSGQRILQGFQEQIENTENTNLILATIPLRHDNPGLDGKVSYLNAKIETLAKTHAHVRVLPLHLLPRHLYSRPGLHFNKKGKETISKMIIDQLRCFQPLQRTVNVQPVSAPEASCHQPTIFSSSPKLPSTSSVTLKKTAISVIEMDMGNVIDRLRGDPSVAFSHSISQDLHDKKNMSAGVAVSFKIAFGKPDQSQYVNSHLTLQKIQNGAAVYSLVTKPKYFQKPRKEDYDIAFTQLKQNFQSNGYKSLICSAMGCVRDRIQPEHFARNIVEFQRATQANVTVVSQESYSTLWNGLTHKEFVEKLRLAIAEECKVTTVQSPKENKSQSNNAKLTFLET